MSPDLRPKAMRLNEAQCIYCELCYELAPIIRSDPERIPVRDDTLEAMAACPTGAIVWREPTESKGVSMKTLDVRSMVPRERHPTIFGLFDDLKSGESFELINDHDPKPLYYQLQAERPGALDWEYVEEGPDTWRVRIGRV